MKNVFIAFWILAVIFWSGCGSDSPVGNRFDDSSKVGVGSGEKANDSDKVVIDSEKGTVDAGKAMVDSGKATVDTGKTVVDSEKVTVDTGKTVVDSGKATVDTGKTVVDSGKATVDTGMAVVDTGIIVTIPETVSGLVQRGFIVRNYADDIVAKEKKMESKWIVSKTGKAAKVDSISGLYVASISDFKEKYVELETYDNEFFYDRRYGTQNRLIRESYLTAPLNLDLSKTTNVNYLTTIITPLVWEYVPKMTFSAAYKKAAKVLLQNLHMPEDLTDFGNYSLFGKGEGDAMLAAVTIAMENFVGDAYETTMWRSFDLDVSMEKFKREDVYEFITEQVFPLFRENEIDSLRKYIESVSPNGYVPKFEKYLSMMFADYVKWPRCVKSIQGKKVLYEYYDFAEMICDDSVWRYTKMEDYDTSTIFNADLNYGTLVDSRDGQKYKTIEIDGRTWMAENLNYHDSVTSENLKGQSWCYGLKESNCNRFGRLYSWMAAMDIAFDSLKSATDIDKEQSICPDGWHLPSWYEFTALSNSIDRELFSNYMTNATNKSGFSLLQGGYATFEKDDSGEAGQSVLKEKMNFEAMMGKTCLWLWRSYGSDYADYMLFHYSTNTYPLYKEQKDVRSGCYVRCVKNDGTDI